MNDVAEATLPDGSTSCQTELAVLTPKLVPLASVTAAFVNVVFAKGTAPWSSPKSKNHATWKFDVAGAQVDPYEYTSALPVLRFVMVAAALALEKAIVTETVSPVEKDGALTGADGAGENATASRRVSGQLLGSEDGEDGRLY
jgi:hypothetical protein